MLMKKSKSVASVLAHLTNKERMISERLKKIENQMKNVKARNAKMYLKFKV